MLVLSRKPGERIRIGTDIFLEVRRVEGNRVTVAIDAPKDVHILRGELEPFADEPPPVPRHASEETYRAECYRIPRQLIARRASLQPVGT